MLEKIIIHIGTEKTGSTSIQHFLDVNAQTLNGYGFHVIQCATSLSHVKFALFACFGEEATKYLKSNGIHTPSDKQQFDDEFKKDLADEMANLPHHIHTIIISNEHLQSKLTTPQEVENLRDLLSGYAKSIEIICYLREQSSLLNSRHSEYLKGGFIKPFRDIVAECHLWTPFYNHETLLARWAGVFSKEKITVRIFERDSLYKASLLEDFVHCIDASLDFSVFKETVLMNKSLNLKGLEIALQLNRLLLKQGEFRVSGPIRNIVRKHLEADFSGNETIITTSLYKAINNHFEESNARVCRDYFPDRLALFKQPKNLPDSNQTPEIGLLAYRYFMRVIARRLLRKPNSKGSS